jgi:predicted DNA-binding protein
MSKRTSIRIPDELYDYLVARAQYERRTVSNLIVNMLAVGVDLLKIADQNSTQKDSQPQKTPKRKR